MVKNRHDTERVIPEIGYTPAIGTPVGVEVLSLAQLRIRAGHHMLTTAHRPAFHQLMLLTHGSIRHCVDFNSFVIATGTWLWVRPNQVQQWEDSEAADGTMILFEQDFLDPATVNAVHLDDPYRPVLCKPAGDDQRALIADAAQFTRTFATPGTLTSDLHSTVLRHLLAALVIRLDHLSTVSDNQPTEHREAFLRFRAAVERDFVRNRRVEDYARSLGYSARTLARATQSAAGVNAKDFIDRRVLLEAKRLLAHSENTAAQIATSLGFSSATNFSKYFFQRTGTTPIAFRNLVHSNRPPAPGR